MTLVQGARQFAMQGLHARHRMMTVCSSRQGRTKSRWIDGTPWTASSASGGRAVSMMANTAPVAFAARMTFTSFVRETRLPSISSSCSLSLLNTAVLEAVQVDTSVEDDDG
jgi:hypothetical protein